MGRAHKLKPLQVERLNQAGLHGDGAGLWLKVSPGGSKSWIYRYMIDGRDRWMGLGSFPDVSLAEARELAGEARKKIRSGTDPIDEKREKQATDRAARMKAVTFDWCAEQFITAHSPAWKNPKHVDQWRNTLATYASPTIGKLIVSSIDTGHIMKILEPIWTKKTETATRVRGRVESVLDWATTRKFRSGENPARWKGHLDTLLPAPTKLKRQTHFAALPYKDMPDFMTALRKQAGTAARAVEFAILTAARSGEVRGMTWAEVDLEAGVWIVPAERMKAGKEHRVPLTDKAIKVLKTMQEGVTSELVFPGMKGKPLSDMSLTAVLRRMERRDITVHGFRSSFRDWAAEVTSYPAEMAEMALAHTVADKVEAAYRRGDMFEKRRRMMRDWAKHCDTATPAGEVVPIRSNTAA